MKNPIWWIVSNTICFSAICIFLYLESITPKPVPELVGPVRPAFTWRVILLSATGKEIRRWTSITVEPHMNHSIICFKDEGNRAVYLQTSMPVVVEEEVP